jgi:hypothetical protein
MKIASDMYFEQIGYFKPDPTNPDYQGEQVNTFQVRTFELFNKEKQSSFSGQMNANIKQEYQSWTNYLPGTIVLDSEIGHDDTRIIEIDNSGITPVLIIRAENIEVAGEVNPQSGYNLRIEAMEDIKILDGGKLLPNVTARTVLDFYGNGFSLPATSNEVSAFCSSENYLASSRSKKAMEFEEKKVLRNQLQAVKSELAVSAYPNPASTFVQIAVQNQPQQITDMQLVVSDLTGRQVLAETRTANAAGRYVLNLPELATGVYMLQVTAGDKTAVEKIIVQ